MNFIHWVLWSCAGDAGSGILFRPGVVPTLSAWQKNCIGPASGLMVCPFPVRGYVRTADRCRGSEREKTAL